MKKFLLTMVAFASIIAPLAVVGVQAVESAPPAAADTWCSDQLPGGGSYPKMATQTIYGMKSETYCETHNTINRGLVETCAMYYTTAFGINDYIVIDGQCNSNAVWLDFGNCQQNLSGGKYRTRTQWYNPIGFTWYYEWSDITISTC